MTFKAKQWESLWSPKLQFNFKMDGIKRKFPRQDRKHQYRRKLWPPGRYPSFDLEVNLEGHALELECLADGGFRPKESFFTIIFFK